MQLLRRCLTELNGESKPDAYIRERLEQMMEFFQSGTAAYEELKQLSPQTLRGLLRMRGRLRKLVRPLAG